MSEYIIDWQAWATLATGILAVSGAVAVGIKQNKITKRLADSADRQISILSRQVALEELTLRNEVFERRFKIYDATAEYLRQILQRADAPDAEVMQAFVLAVRECEFLFDPSVTRRMNALWAQSNRFFAQKRESKFLYAKEGHYGNFPRKEYRLLVWFSRRLERLPDLFGNDLRLWHRGTS